MDVSTEVEEFDVLTDDDDVKDLKISLCMDDTNEMPNFDMGFNIDMDMSTEFDDFDGFTADDVKLSRCKAHTFNYVMNGWQISI